MKTPNLQQLAVEHAEKLVLGVVGLLFVVALFSAFTREVTAVTPSGLNALVQQADQRLREGYDAAGARGRDQAVYLAEVVQGLTADGFENVRLEVPARQVAPVRDRLARVGLSEVPVVGNEEIDEPRVAVDDWIRRPIAMLISPVRGDYHFLGPLFEEPRPTREDNAPIDLLAVRELRTLYERVPVWVHPTARGVGEVDPDERAGAGTQQREGDDRDALARRADDEDDAATSTIGSVEGMRWVAVRGIVPVAEQLQEIADALNLGLPANAAPYLAYLDFQVERQRAVPGPDPWPDDEQSWERVQFETIEEYYARMDGEDPEVVDVAFINSTLAVPLPPRAIGTWEVPGGHPGLAVLSEADRLEQQEEIEEAFQEIERDAEQDTWSQGLGGDRFRRRIETSSGAGYSTYGGVESVQRSRSGDGGSDMGAASDAYARYIEQMQQGRREAAPLMSTADRMPRGFMPTNPLDVARNRIVVGRSQGGRGVTSSNELLFRFLDFTVQPGQAYRYRVRLVLSNPNYGLDPSQVTQEAIDAGQRPDQMVLHTPWSEPTAPVYVPPDTSYYVAGASPRGEIQVRTVAWDRDLGTLAEAILWAGLGDEIAGMQATTRANPELYAVEEGVRMEFDTNDLLLDFAARSVEGQLEELGAAPVAIEAPTDVLVLNQWGELVLRNEASDSPQYQAASRRVLEQQNLYPTEEEDDDSDGDQLNQYYERYLQGQDGNAHSGR